MKNEFPEITLWIWSLEFTLNVKINIQAQRFLTYVQYLRRASFVDIRQVTETVTMIEEQNFDVVLLL